MILILQKCVLHHRSKIVLSRLTSKDTAKRPGKSFHFKPVTEMFNLWVLPNTENYYACKFSAAEFRNDISLQWQEV